MTTDHAATALRMHIDQPWRARAACTGLAAVMDPPIAEVKAARELGMERHLWQDAKEICWACPVNDQCQRWVLSLPRGHDQIGVCGGLTEEERQRLRRRSAALAALQKKEIA